MGCTLSTRENKEEEAAEREPPPPSAQTTADTDAANLVVATHRRIQVAPKRRARTLHVGETERLMPIHASPAATYTAMDPNADLDRRNVRHVVIVDDSRVKARILLRQLEAYLVATQPRLRFVFDFCDSGEGALQMMQRRTTSHVDVVFTDFHMGVMDGATMAQLCAAMSPETRFIGYSDDETARAEFARLGITTFIAKPFIRSEVWAAFHNALAPVPRAAENSKPPLAEMCTPLTC